MQTGKTVQALIEESRSLEHVGEVATAIQRAQQALQLAGECQDSAGETAAMLALALEPWQEQAALLGMRASLGLNERAGALRMYRDLEKSLRDELGAEPLPELQAFYRKSIRSRGLPGQFLVVSR